MTRFQAMKKAEIDAARTQRPVTVIHDMESGRYDCFPGDVSLGEIIRRSPSYQRVLVVWPQPKAAA